MRAAGPRPARPLHVLGACALACLVAACDTPDDAADARYTAIAGSDRDRGRRLLSQYQCGGCHAIPGLPAAEGALGPPLAAFGRSSYIAGQVPNGPTTLPRWIEHPQALVPGTAMPDLGASPADARDMAAYLLSLR